MINSVVEKKTKKKAAAPMVVQKIQELKLRF